MESLKHPATILATFDTVGLLVLWAHFKGQIEELQKTCEEKTKVNPALQESVDKNFGRVAEDVQTLDRRLRELGSHVVAQHKVLLSLEQRVSALEGKDRKQVSKGDSDPVMITESLASPSFVSSAALQTENEETQEEASDEDEVDLVVSLAKKKK